jgi:hypothetical protein
MTKTLNQIIFIFPPPKSEYFFQQHWESEYFFRKKTITFYIHNKTLLDEVHETARVYIDLRKKRTLPCPEL